MEVQILAPPEGGAQLLIKTDLRPFLDVSILAPPEGGAQHLVHREIAR
jgi:hypothetical protein